MKEHNRKMYDEMVKAHHDAKEFETFKSIFLAVALIVVVAGVVLTVFS